MPGGIYVEILCSSISTHCAAEPRRHTHQHLLTSCGWFYARAVIHLGNLDGKVKWPVDPRRARQTRVEADCAFVHHRSTPTDQSIEHLGLAEELRWPSHLDPVFEVLKRLACVLRSGSCASAELSTLVDDRPVPRQRLVTQISCYNCQVAGAHAI